MMQTEQPQSAPPSRYRTIRRKLASNLKPAPLQPAATTSTSAPAAVVAAIEPQKRNALARNPSKFRKILRLNTRDAPTTPPVPPAPAAATPHHHHNKLVKNPTSPRKQTSRFGKGRERSAGGFDGGSSTEENATASERERVRDVAQNYDLRVPVDLSRGKESIGILKSTDVESFLAHVRPGKNRILVESWPILGLQRQIRYFEKLGDVFNTWETETKCHFRVEKQIYGRSDRRLELFTSADAPSGVAQFQQYVQAEKKWVKRWIKLDNGLLKISKKDKPTEKDFTQTINLESFDVYTFVNPFSPGSKLKCPTKYCFALKSQHKMSLFGEGSVYCHYFSADSEALLSQWYTIIRDSKTRLIAEKKAIAPWAVEPVSEKDDMPISPRSISSGAGSIVGRRHGHKPLISPEELGQSSGASDARGSKSLRRAKSSKQPSSTNPPRTPVGGSVSDGEAVFSPGGLLGSDYEGKKRTAQLAYREERAKPHNDFSGLLTSQAPKARNFSSSQPLVSLESSKDSKSPRRRETVSVRPSTSHSKQGGTLLNFDSEELVPSLPHHRRGRGHTISERDTRGGGGLITLVKSPLEAPPLPTSPLFSQQFKRPTNSRGQSRHGEASGDEDQTAFTGTGLLAANYQSAGAVMVGHGVANSKDAIGRNGEITPLINPHSKSVFAPGSLLERREREMGPQRPVIDRDYHSEDDDS